MENNMLVQDSRRSKPYDYCTFELNYDKEINGHNVKKIIMNIATHTVTYVVKDKDDNTWFTTEKEIVVTGVKNENGKYISGIVHTFSDYLKREMSHENFDFLVAVAEMDKTAEELSKTMSTTEKAIRGAIKPYATRIFSRFIAQTVDSLQVNIPDDVDERLKSSLRKYFDQGDSTTVQSISEKIGKGRGLMFEEAALVIKKLVSTDSIPRFLKSEAFKMAVEEELPKKIEQEPAKASTGATHASTETGGDTGLSIGRGAGVGTSPGPEERKNIVQDSDSILINSIGNDHANYIDQVKTGVPYNTLINNINSKIGNETIDSYGKRDDLKSYCIQLKTYAQLKSRELKKIKEMEENKNWQFTAFKVAKFLGLKSDVEAKVKATIELAHEISRYIPPQAESLNDTAARTLYLKIKTTIQKNKDAHGRILVHGFGDLRPILNNLKKYLRTNYKDVLTQKKMVSKSYDKP